MGVAVVVCLLGGNFVLKALLWPLSRARAVGQSHTQVFVLHDLGGNQLTSFQVPAEKKAAFPIVSSNQYVSLQLQPLPSGTNKNVWVLGVRVDTNAAAAPANRLHVPIVNLGPASSFIVAFQVAIYAGMVFAAPFILYFLAAFVFPALKMKEKKDIYRGMFWGLGLFFTGVGFCYFILMPVALSASVKYTEWLGLTAPLWRAEDYIGFVTKFMLGMGVGFEMPVIILILVKIGILDYAKLSAARRYVIVLNFVLGAVLTTPEIITQVLMAVPMQILYEITVWWLGIGSGKRKNARRLKNRRSRRPSRTSGSRLKHPSLIMKTSLLRMAVGLLFAMASGLTVQASAVDQSWQVGTPIVTYWCGPSMSEAAAKQLAEGGWNVVWCGEKDLDLLRQHGLRGQLQNSLLTPATLDNPGQREKLDALIQRVRSHPALYSYFITDEPSAAQFPALGRLVAYLRERDPAHLAYINLFPTYANNKQLGNSGDTVAAYRAHLRQYVDTVKPSLISYDHYQFAKQGDTAQYFLNLALIRKAALDARLPFLNIVQACTWTPAMRVPQGDEMRYLVYTTLAYGAQGISYYVYSCPGHTGGIAQSDGTPTPLYHVLKSLNREFVAIASELQPLQSLAVYHAGMMPPGAVPLPENAPFTFDPPVPAVDYHPPERVKGVLMGYFGSPTNDRKSPAASHLVVVNLDYGAEVDLGIRGPGSLEVFDAKTGKWSAALGRRTQLHLPRGGGRLVRVKP